jgi:soluble cytochrome b562
MREEGAAFDKLMEEIGLAAKWEQAGEVRGKKEGLKEAVDLLKQGYTVEQIEQMALLCE